MPTVYWDYNATAPIRAEVADEARRFLEEGPSGNPASVHGAGRAARAHLDESRTRLARALGCEARDICFTASGSEANALALKGVFLAQRETARRRLVVSAIEHPSVLLAARQLEALGATVTQVLPKEDGRVRVEDIRAALGPDVFLCSMQWANNETGVVQPVDEVLALCREQAIPFHCDAVQAAGKIPIAARPDLMSITAHKIGGTKGSAALVARRTIALTSLVAGHQEWGRRGGTQDLLAARVLAVAVELAQDDARSRGAALAELRDRFEATVLERISGVRVNGAAPRLPNTSNLLFDGADGEALLVALDLEGIHVSTGAACASGSLTPSHVLTAMGRSNAEASASLRFSLGHSATDGEVRTVIEALVRHVPGARKAAAALA